MSPVTFHSCVTVRPTMYWYIFYGILGHEVFILLKMKVHNCGSGLHVIFLIARNVENSKSLQFHQGLHHSCRCGLVAHTFMSDVFFTSLHTCIDPVRAKSRCKRGMCTVVRVVQLGLQSEPQTRVVFMLLFFRIWWQTQLSNGCAVEPV